MVDITFSNKKDNNDTKYVPLPLKEENMNIENNNSNFIMTPNPLNKKFFESIPIEGIAYLVASIAVRVFSVSLSYPLLGIGLAMVVTNLALKTIEWYDNQLIIDLTKEACKFNRAYPNLQRIMFASALAISFLTETLSFVVGIYLGSFGTILMDIENYKRLQEERRKQQGCSLIA